MKFEFAPDVHAKVEDIVQKLNLNHIDSKRIFCIRSFNSKARAYARIWPLSKVWQKCLGIRAHYIIEVIQQHYEKLPDDEKEKVLIHELLHIPKNFSGAVLNHSSTCFDGKGDRITRRIDRKTVESYYKKYKEASI
jgi:predicted metallopeptidase